MAQLDHIVHGAQSATTYWRCPICSHVQVMRTETISQMAIESRNSVMRGHDRSWSTTMNNLIIGVVLVLLAAGLVLICRPNRAGQHPRFLRFEASLVLFPPVILVFAAFGMAAIISGLLGTSH